MNHYRRADRSNVALRPGWYTIEWRVLSEDTHETDGVLRFTLGSRAT